MSLERFKCTAKNPYVSGYRPAPDVIQHPHATVQDTSIHPTYGTVWKYLCPHCETEWTMMTSGTVLNIKTRQTKGEDTDTDKGEE
jgi:hypothetical protein